jgi:hypothetical protein
VVTRQEKNLVQQKYKRIDLTPTGLLMEAYYTQNVRPPHRISCNPPIPTNDASMGERKSSVGFDAVLGLVFSRCRRLLRGDHIAVD